MPRSFAAAVNQNKAENVLIIFTWPIAFFDFVRILTTKPDELAKQKKEIRQ
jgi:hypothetical protein